MPPLQSFDSVLRWNPNQLLLVQGAICHLHRKGVTSLLYHGALPLLPPLPVLPMHNCAPQTYMQWRRYMTYSTSSEFLGRSSRYSWGLGFASWVPTRFPRLGRHKLLSKACCRELQHGGGLFCFTKGAILTWSQAGTRPLGWTRSVTNAP